MSYTQISLTIVQLLIMTVGVYFSATNRLNFNRKKQKVNSYLHKLIGLVNDIDKIEKGFSKKAGISDIKKQYFKEITGIYTTLDNQKKIVKFKEKTLNDKYNWWDIKTVLNKHLFENKGSFYVKIFTSQKISYWLVWL